MAHLGTDDYEQVLRRLGVDARYVIPRPSDSGKEKWARFREGVREARTVEDLKRMDWPTWDMLWDCSHLREDMQKILDMDEQYAIYIPGWGGVRIEDVIVMENEKVREISKARKD